MSPTVIGMKKKARCRIRNDALASNHRNGTAPLTSNASRNSIPKRLPGTGRWKTETAAYPA